jgi:hypothetical protein
MNCLRPECAEPIQRCPAKHGTGSCWYFNCLGWVHLNQRHACADMGGDAQPEPGTLPLAGVPAGEPEGEVA